MNRLKILLITGALITGSSALASAQEHYQTGFSVQVRLGDRDKGAFFYGHGDGDDHNFGGNIRYFNGDRDDRYFDRDDHYRRGDRDDRWRWNRDRDDRRFRDYDHDGDRH